ncbi:hypothetical protein IV102_18570 [bacterium]|nr:hypothetical protein [bacterium]
MTHIIDLNAPLTGQDASLVARARQVRERAESVKADLLAAPSDSVQLDERASNEFLGCFSYTGSIGQDHFSRANASLWEGKLGSFAAHDAPATPGETLKFHLTTTKAIGLRSGIAAALGAVAGGLGHGASWLLAKAITNVHKSEVGAKILVMASKPLEFGCNVMRLAERSVADPGTKDEYYAVAAPSGEYEQFRFTANGTLEHDYFAPKA